MPPEEFATMILDGEEVTFTPGETIYAVAERLGKDIPTLCHDPRLEPFGGCRLCVVELEGSRNPVPSCSTQAASGMVVNTRTDRLEKLRKILLELVVSEVDAVDVDPLRGRASQEFRILVDRYQARTGRFSGRRRAGGRQDANPFILRDDDKCIYCYRCVRVCAERAGSNAISVGNRGFRARITTEFDGLLKDSHCSFCGQCVQTCPTGALADKKALRNAGAPGEIRTTRSVCAYCGVGCSVDILTRDHRIVAVQPAVDGPSNQGRLCVKGQFAFDFVHHADRLTKPLVRGDDGELRETSWEEALDRVAEGFLDALDKHGRHSVYAVASGRAPNEGAYLVQKWIRSGFGTNYVDNCSRA